MCCRYRLGLEKYDIKEIDKLKILFELSYPYAIFPNGDVFPTDLSPVLVRGTDKAEVSLMKWGFITKYKKLVINAKSESINTKSMFKENLRNRCVIVVSGFYEWTEDENHDRFFFSNSTNGKPLYLAGIFSDTKPYKSFVIVTKEPNLDMKEIHNRMPLILDQNDVNVYLNNQVDLTRYSKYDKVKIKGEFQKK